MYTFLSHFDNNLKTPQDTTYFSFCVIYDGQVASILTRKLLHDLKRNLYYGGVEMIKAGKMNLLLFRIKVKRIVMYKKAENLGFTHPSVVECSHELDILLNRVQGICS